MAVPSKARAESSRQVQGSDARTDASPILVPMIVLLLSMGACATIPPEAPPMASVRCSAEAARWAIGREPSSDVVERARVESGSATVRVARPGDVIDQDLRGDRLHLTINARNAIEGVACS